MREDENCQKSLTARRLKLAIQLSKYGTLQEIATNFGLDVDTVTHWQLEGKGIPYRRLRKLAHFFHVQPTAFTDNNISDDDFVRIIANPPAMDQPMSDSNVNPPLLSAYATSSDDMFFLHRLNTSSEQLLGAYKNSILAVINKMQEQEAGFFDHFYITCRGKKELLEKQERLEEIDKIFEKQLHGSQNIVKKHMETKTALRAIKCLIEISSEPRYHDRKCHIYYDELRELITKIKDVKDLTATKFERLKWLLDSVCIESSEVCLRGFEDIKRPDYDTHIEALLLVFEFGFAISHKETLQDYIYGSDQNDDSRFYMCLLMEAFDILEIYEQDRSQGYPDPENKYEYWRNVIDYFYEKLDSDGVVKKPCSTPFDRYR